MNQPTPPQRLYTEDLALGMRFSTRSYEMGAAQIIDFARQFDPQPFHTDPEAAAKSLFGGLVASGWHTASVTMRLLVESLPFEGGLIGAGGECRWPMATKAGDHLHAEIEIVAIKPSKSQLDRSIVTVKVTTLNQDHQIVQILTAYMVVKNRHAVKLAHNEPDKEAI